MQTAQTSTTWLIGFPPVPDARTVLNLLVGGLVGLIVWEAWASYVTPLVIGGPLEPPGLVVSLAQALFGYKLAIFPATVIHWIIGIVGYPLLYYIVSRTIPKYGLVLEIVLISAFTAFLANRLLNDTATQAMIWFWLVVVAVASTRLVNPNVKFADALSWGAFTWFNALGIMAPIANLPFLLLDWGGQLSFMSYVGHAIFGFILAIVFEALEKRRHN